MFYRRNLPHLQRDNKPHFVTFVTKKRALLPGWARDIVLVCCKHDHKLRYELYVAIVMPDHVHLILTPLVDVQRAQVFPLPEIMKAIKGTSAHAINRLRGHSGSAWQEESFARVLRCAEKLEEKIECLLDNPVRKRIVNQRGAYKWVWQNADVPPQKARTRRPGRAGEGTRPYAICGLPQPSALL